MFLNSASKRALPQSTFLARTILGSARATSVGLSSRSSMPGATRCSSANLANTHQTEALFPIRHGTHASNIPVDCPFAAGASLNLILVPPSYGPSEELSVRATIVKAFVPFTIGQALLVELLDYPYAQSLLPRQFLLKLYDRRFTKNRVAPWTPLLEARLRTYLRQAKEGSRPSPPLESFGDSGGDEDGVWDSDHPRFEEWHDDIVVWERLQDCLDTEIAAYRRLEDLQGFSIPRLYGSVRVRVGSPKPESWMPTWMHHLLDVVDGMALQYIDGVTALDFKRGVNISEQDAARLCQGAIQITRDITIRGVVHNDIAARNVLVRRSDMRPFLIDFGSASIFTHPPNGVNQMDEMRSALQGLHINSPYPPSKMYFSPLEGWAKFNRKIESLSHEERTKGWVRVASSGSDHETRWDAEGRKHKFEYLQWQLRAGVRTRDKDWDIA